MFGRKSRNIELRRLSNQLDASVEELADLSGMLTHLLVLVEDEVRPKTVRDLSLSLAMSYRLARTVKATLMLTRALHTELYPSSKKEKRNRNS